MHIFCSSFTLILASFSLSKLKIHPFVVFCKAELLVILYFCHFRVNCYLAYINIESTNIFIILRLLCYFLKIIDLVINRHIYVDLKACIGACGLLVLKCKHKTVFLEGANNVSFKKN